MMVLVDMIKMHWYYCRGSPRKSYIQQGVESAVACSHSWLCVDWCNGSVPLAFFGGLRGLAAFHRPIDIVILAVGRFTGRSNCFWCLPHSSPNREVRQFFCYDNAMR